ncbi:MAG: VCBS repeat-containing protein [Thermoanaerobaculia bacterium]|nr:VCBS repeat-containing protein [Thermoanaerobaculia bacterium]
MPLPNSSELQPVDPSRHWKSDCLRPVLAWLTLAGLAAGTTLAQGPYHREFIQGLHDTLGTELPHVESADMDDDGDLDILVGLHTGLILYYENVSTPELLKFNDQDSPNPTNPFSEIHVDGFADPKLADLDSDGDLDLLVGDWFGNLEYFENTGTADHPLFDKVGTFDLFGGVDIGFYTSPDLADVDGDGDLDALVGRDVGWLHYFENTGTPTAPVFAEVTGSENPFLGIETAYQGSNPDLVDFDSDGDYDLLVGGKIVGNGNVEQETVLRYFENVGTPQNPDFVEVLDSDSPLYGIATFEDLIYRGLPAAWDRSPEIADLDGDGDLDVFIAVDDRIDVFRRACAGQLCLLDGRFSVTAQWQDHQGNTGSARATALNADDSGTLWFFAPENPELMVKVIDACSFNGHYWVFASGLTDVEVRLTVVDTSTGLPKHYDNQLQEPFQPIQDTAAFATCP